MLLRILLFFLSSIKDIKLPSIPTLKIPLIATFDDLDVQIDEEDELKARGNKVG